MQAMKPGEAKTVFAYLMKVSRKRKLTEYEIQKLTEARQTLRRQARPAMNRKKDYTQYGGKHYMQHRKESITTGTPVLHRKDKDFGRVQRVLASGDLIVKWDDGETSQVTQSAVKTILETPKSHRLPNHGIKIYGRCLRIEAIKMVEHLYNGRKARATQRYFHDFTSKNAIIYGLPDGSLLIKSR